MTDLSDKRIRITVAKIVQRKREHNTAVRNGDKRKLELEIAKFDEIQKEIEKQIGSDGKPLACHPLMLENALKNLIRSRELVAMDRGFVIAGQYGKQEVEKHWFGK